MKKIYKSLLALFSILIMGMGTIWASSDTKDGYSDSYFTIESLVNNNTVTIYIPDGLTSAEMTSLSYSTNGTDWTTVTINSTNQNLQVVLNQGEKVYVKGLGKQCSSADGQHHISFDSSRNFIVYGNIMSLLYGDDFATQTTCPVGSTYTFAELFVHDETCRLVSAEHLVMPAAPLSDHCYYGLFYGCSKLTVAPELPATSLGQASYMYMFANCTSLTEAPDLCATTVPYCCCYRMFQGCSALVEAPELPATTLAGGSYYNMFNGCTSLTEAPALPATNLGVSCYEGMFNGCHSLLAAPELPATTLAYACYYDMFDDCTALTETPVLPATTLVEECYCGMFYECTSLTTVHEIAATTLAQASCSYMFYGCTSLTEVPDMLFTDLADGCCYFMFGGCSSLTRAPQMPATTMAYYCYSCMFYQCTNLTTPPELPSTNLAVNCYSCMFDQCTSLTSAPELPAPVLVDSCYFAMFEGCTSLTEVTCMATDISARDCVLGWMYYVAPAGTFYKAPEMENWPVNSWSGIPMGWTIANYDAVDEQQDQIVAYPNPVIDKLHITGTDIQSVKVFDIQGRMVHSEECGHADQVEVDFQGFAKGVYTVSILSEGRTINQQIVF